MTCIAGLAHKGKVWMGADSCATLGDALKSTIASQKIWRDGPMLFGCAGMPRVRQVLLHQWQRPDRDPRWSTEAYLCGAVIESMRDCLEKRGVMNASDENGSGMSSTLLLGYEGHLYMIDGAFQLVERREGFDSIGSGCEPALAVLYATRGQKMKPERRIVEALEASAWLNPGVAPPFVIDSI